MIEFLKIIYDVARTVYCNLTIHVLCCIWYTISIHLWAFISEISIDVNNLSVVLADSDSVSLQSFVYLSLKCRTNCCPDDSIDVTNAAIVCTAVVLLYSFYELIAPTVTAHHLQLHWSSNVAHIMGTNQTCLCERDIRLKYDIQNYLQHSIYRTKRKHCSSWHVGSKPKMTPLLANRL